MSYTPPLLTHFDDTEQFLHALGTVTSEEARMAVQAIDRGFPPAVGVASTAVLFGYTPHFIRYVRKVPADFYRVFELHVRGKTRRISAPRVALKVFQSWFSHHASRAVGVLPHVYSFTSGRSHLSAASKHCGARWLVSVDIRDFFGSISAAQVESALRTIGYPETAAHFLSPFLVLDDKLPQGAPSSPFLSNIVGQMVDNVAACAAEQQGWTYTRYADDLVISGGSAPEDVDAAELLLRRSIESAGFEVRDDKTTRAVAPGRMEVHGLSVVRNRIRLPKRTRNEMRRIDWVLRHKRDQLPQQETERYEGLLAYLTQVESWGQSE